MDAENKKLLISAITADNFERVNGKCWDGAEHQKEILRRQGILGFAVWDADGACIAQLHCYIIWLPGADEGIFPWYARRRLAHCPLGLPFIAANEKGLIFDGPVMLLSCYHVGLKLGTSQEDSGYFRRGIGSALLDYAIRWAKDNGMRAIIAHGGTPLLPEYNIWMGCLPRTAYEKRGFKTLAVEENGERFAWWKDGAPEDFQKQIDKALKTGLSISDINARAMILVCFS